MSVSVLDAPASVPVQVQAQIFETVVSDDLLTGTIHALARRFGISTTAFQACLDGLVRARWVTVSTDRDGLCRIRLDL